MPESDPRNCYCVIGVHWADSPDKPEFLSVEGKIVVFDTPNMAREVLPRLFAGRRHVWDKDEETLFAVEFHPKGFNRLAIWTGYDPYDVPNGFRAKGVYSEAKARDWKSHVYWNHVLGALLSWADQLEAQRLEAERISTAMHKAA